MFELSFRPLKTILSILFCVNFSLFSVSSTPKSKPVIKTRQKEQLTKKRKFLAATAGFTATAVAMGVGKLIHNKVGAKNPRPASFDIDGFITKILDSSGINDLKKRQTLTLLLNHKITMVFSQLIGDALGAPIEIVGSLPSAGYSRSTPDNVSDMQGGAKISGISRRTAGEFTDDGSMMLALLAAFSKIIEYKLEWILELGSDKPSPLPSIVMYEFWKLMTDGEHACPSCVNPANTFKSQQQLFWNTQYADGKPGPTIMLTEKPPLPITAVVLTQPADGSFVLQITFNDNSTVLSNKFFSSWSVVRQLDGAIPQITGMSYIKGSFVPAGYAIQNSFIYFDSFVMPWVKHYLLQDTIQSPTDKQIITFLAQHSYPAQQLFDLEPIHAVSPKKQQILQISQLKFGPLPTDFDQRLSNCAYPPYKLNSEAVTNGCLMRGAGVHVVSDNEDQIINLANNQTKATHTAFGCTSLGKVYSKFVNEFMHHKQQKEVNFKLKVDFLNTFADAMVEDPELRTSAVVHSYLFTMMKYLVSISNPTDLQQLRMAKWTARRTTPNNERTANKEWYLDYHDINGSMQTPCLNAHGDGNSSAPHWCFGDSTKATTRFDFGYVIPSSGSGAGCIVAAIWAWLAHDNAKDTLLALANLKYDSDTVAAIGGELVGATYEFKDIPANWIDTLGGSSGTFNKDFKDKLEKYLETCLTYMIKNKK